MVLHFASACPLKAVVYQKHGKDVIDSKRHRINGEKFAGDDISGMIFQKSTPCLRWRFWMPKHVFCNS